MNIFKEFKYMLSSDGSDKFSSKRVITFLAFLLVSVAFIANTFWGVIVDTAMFSGVIQIVWAGLGVVVGEHLLKKKHAEAPQSNVEAEVEAKPDDLGDN
jgi:hypothetical protein